MSFGNQRPNLNPNGGSPNFHKSLTSWFDKTKYVVAPQYQYGHVLANTLRSDAFRQYDASIFKNFAMPGESTLSFRAEFFNLPNTSHFGGVGGTSLSGNGTMSVTSGSFMQITSASGERQVRFGLRATW